MFALNRYLSLALIVFQGACLPAPAVKSIARIADNAEWKLQPACAAEGCYPIMDYLVSRDVRFRLSPITDLKGIFILSLDFESPESYKSTAWKRRLAFDPSSVVLKFKGREYVGKPYTCASVSAANVAGHSETTLTGKVSLAEHECFSFIFDQVSVSAEDAYSIHIDGLYREGQEFRVPEIVFEKGSRR